MHVLITGNQGYVGSVVCAHLRATWPEATLTGFDTGYFSQCLTDKTQDPESSLDLQIPGDLRQLPEKLLDGVDVVVHLAGISNDPMGKVFEHVTAAINQESSINLARIAKSKGVARFIFASSCSMYGSADAYPRKENSPLNPLTAYARSKIGAEEGLGPLADEHFSVTCLRFATACGYSPRLRLDLVLNDFVATAIRTGQIRILSDGTPWRPLIHVKDMALAIEWACTRQSFSQPFLAVNTGCDTWNFQVHELAHAVQTYLEGTEIVSNPGAIPDKRSYQVDFSSYRELAPGHQPRQTLEGTIRELADGIRKKGFAEPGFQPSEYVRLEILQGLLEKGRINQELYWLDPRS